MFGVRFIPVVFPEVLNVFEFVSSYFRYAILPGYLIDRGDVGWVRDFLDSMSVRWILSSVMPDEFLAREDIHVLFSEIARDLDIDLVIVWDMPTYLERCEEGWRNIDRCLELLDWFESEGFKIIPLVKGAYEDQIRYHLSRVLERGYNVLAFRATEYMRSKYPPYPELPYESRDPKDLLLKYVKLILSESSVKELVLIGAANPKYYSFLDVDDRIVFSGASWYLDAKRYYIHVLNGRRFVGDCFYECSCPSCRYLTARDRRSSFGIALHNLHIDRILFNDESYPLDISFYDLIIDDFEDVVIAANLYVGECVSFWREFIEEMEKVRPRYLILAGNVIYPFSDADREDYREFVEKLASLYDRYGIITLFMKGYLERKPINILANRTLLFRSGEDPLTSRDASESYLLSLIKYYSIAKSKMRVKKKRLDSDFIIHIESAVIDEVNTYEELVDMYEVIRRNLNADWIIVPCKSKSYMDRNKRVVILGEWREISPYSIEVLPGYVYISRDGDLELRVFEVEPPISDGRL